MIALATALGALSACAAPPNFVFIVADDLGYADVGVHGCKDIPTPHIDSIASSGVRFSNGYSNHPFCSPMRAGFLTGRYQHRFGYETNVPYDMENPNLGLPNDVVTIPERLKKAGYTTAVVGKWHLGAHPSKHPNKRGFDYFFGFLGGGHDYFTSDLSQSQHEGYKAPLMRNGAPLGVEGYLTTQLSEEAAKWIGENKDKPFYLYLAYNAPHTPMQAPEEKLKQFASIKNKKRRTYAGMVSAMDDGIGMVLKALDDAGVRDNTVVAFLSDNGGPEPHNASDNGPLRGTKGTVFEGGIRVPYLVSWPAKLPKGLVFEQPVIALDLPVTALNLAGAPTDGPLDGVDLMPWLTEGGDPAGPPHKALFWRMGNNGRKDFAIRQGNLKFLRQDDLTAVFDLSTDIGEQSPIEKKSAGLMAAWEKWNAPNKRPAFHGFGTYHQKRKAFYQQLEDEPADSPR
ncbi:N-acetylgalactosamine-6-sulfatase [Haloferula helveola]|uniref:N-acetylgalactosamine-6-sulfatase n=2 Tax=Haloferula helveola TaxID=490095 RepID=A0ABM7RG91_9BACT|nr:N-acetylgalactosamine-6-sulfatase [Haloferula helveola]